MQPKVVETLLDAVDDPSDSISRLCSLIHWNMHSFIRCQLKDLDIGRGQLLFLMVLRSHQGLNQNQLAAELEMNKSSVTRGLRRLEDAGLVYRKRNGRSYRLYLSEKASAHMRSLEKVWKEANDLLVEGMSAEQVEDIHSLLTHAYDNSKRGLPHD